MIYLTRLNGPRFVLNADLIERAEEAPDTIITLVDGKHVIVQESLEELIELIRRDRASVLAIARDIEEETAQQPLAKVATPVRDDRDEESGLDVITLRRRR